MVKERIDNPLTNLVDQVANNETSLGTNPSLPNIEFQEHLVLDGFRRAAKRLEREFGDIDKSTNNLQAIMSKLTKSLVEQETPIREQLGRICQNAVIMMLRVPKMTVNMSCELVDKVSPMTNTRLLPEEQEYTFCDVKEKNLADEEIQKRRMVNALVKGVSRSIYDMKDLYEDELNKLNKDLIEQYDKLMALHDYLLFAVDKKVTDKNMGLKAYVGVKLGNNGKRTDIDATGVLFPYLMIETVRGFFELFSTHGLPMDTDKAKYIISKSDYLLAEQWDERYGVGLWYMISEGIEETGLYPYVFTDLCKLEPNDFNKTLSSAFQGNDKELNKIISRAEKNKEFNQFKDDIEVKNLENSILTDGDMTDGELMEHGIKKL